MVSKIILISKPLFTIFILTLNFIFMKTSFLILFFNLIIICNCNKSPNVSESFPPPVVDIHYIDKAGNDLFINDSNNYVRENVRTYTLINKEKSLDSDFDIHDPTKVVYNPYQWGNAYDQDEGDSVYVAAFVLPITKIDYKMEHYFTTLIDLKQGIEDTMKTYITNVNTIDSLWYNNKLLYANSYFPERYQMRKIITIQKEN